MRMVRATVSPTSLLPSTVRLRNKDAQVLLTLIRAGASKDDPELREKVRAQALRKGWSEAAELLR